MQPKLNPHAKVFVPPVSPRVPGFWAGSAKPEPKILQPCCSNTDSAFELFDLPPEVVSQVLSFVSSPSELFKCGVLARVMPEYLRGASPALDFSTSLTASSARVDECKQSAITSTLKYLPGTRALLLASLPMEEAEVEQLLAGLPRLRLLDLSGCRKLPATLPAILQRVAQRTARPVRLHALNLQRCFQLNRSSLTQLLKATTDGTADIDCLALSHLDLGAWPWDAASGHLPAPTDMQDVLTGLFGHRQQQQQCGWADRSHGIVAQSSLQLLALNNCARLSAAGLHTLSTTCGRVRYLLLGGTSLAAAPPAQQPELPAQAKLLPAVRAMVAAAHSPPASTNTTTRHHAQEAATQLVLLALSLPALVALDLTFMPPHVVQCVRTVLAAYHDQQGGPAVQVWDLSTAVGVHCAHSALQDARRAARTAGSAGGGGLDALVVALRCAAASSSPSRTTPLHCAAERGDVASVAALLDLGAGVEARETNGATPLFLAAEAGHVAVVEALLAAGADLRHSNAAGESPLYISSLRGNLGVVEALLAHCQGRGIAWQDPHLYGDCWTPLMAAAVGNRLDVAQSLLQAAGAAAGPLVSAVNKYGQSVVHIAARKAPAKLLRLLLHFGGSAVVAKADTSGETPLDIARKNKHILALAEFRKVCATA